MAINFLNSVDLNKNELIKARIENQPNDASAGTGVEGQLYYNTSDDVIKVWAGGAWTEVGGGVISLTAGTYLTNSGTAEDPIINHDSTTRSDSTSSDSPASGASFEAVTSVTTNATGHVTGIDVSTVTLPVDPDNYVDAVGFSTATGVLTVGRTGLLPDITQSLDGRYALAADIPANIVKTVSTTDGTFIDLTPNTAVDGNVTVTADLSATGTAGSGTFLRGDNAWATPLDSNDFLTGLAFNTTNGVLTATVQNQSNVTVDLDGRYLQGNQTITLSGEVTGSGTTSISTTVANGVLDVANFNASAIVIESEGIASNDNDTTLPTSAAVKAYVDSSVAGGLVYQGGYNAATNTPNLDAPPTGTINKGFTYTVTVDGIFFSEQVRVGDVLIAEIDNPTTLADWTTVQNNIDIATASTIGIGNVGAGTGVDVSYANGTATVSLTAVAASSYATTITDTATVTHNLGTRDVVVQLYDATTFETVYADVDRISTTQTTITFASTPTNSIRVLVQKIG